MIDAASRERLIENWNAVVDEVHQCASSAGRDVDSVTIVGVSKYVDAETTQLLVEAGCRHLGENRPQSLWQKAETLSLDPSVRWHMIGHLQRNKIRRTLRCRPIIHSVDSGRLLAAIAEQSTELDEPMSLMLEVNISGERAKTGMLADELAGLLERLPIGGVRVIGLMAMAGWGTDRDEARRQFAATRTLRDRLTAQSGIELPELSMGMSGDFAEAIAEGSTMVRIGSRLFEGVINHG